MHGSQLRRRGAALGIAGAATLTLIAFQAGAAGAAPRAATTTVPVLQITFPNDTSDGDDTALPIGTATDVDFIVTNNTSAMDTIDLDIGADALLSPSELTLDCGGTPVDLTVADSEDLEGTLPVTAATQTIDCTLTPTGGNLQNEARGLIFIGGALEMNTDADPAFTSAQIPKATPYDESQDLLLQRGSAQSEFYATANTSGGGSPLQVKWGQSTDIYLGGDFGGSGDDYPALYRPSTADFYISEGGTLSGNVLTVDSALDPIHFGRTGDVPLVGNFFIDPSTGAFDSLAVYRPSTETFYIEGIDNGLRFGKAGDIPLVGNWTGSAMGDSIGVYRPSDETFYLLDLDNDSVIATRMGKAGDKPVVGDWSGNGVAMIGLQRGNTYYEATSNLTGAAGPAISFGQATDKASTSSYAFTVPDLVASASGDDDASARVVQAAQVRMNAAGGPAGRSERALAKLF